MKIRTAEKVKVIQETAIKPKVMNSSGDEFRIHSCQEGGVLITTSGVTLKVEEVALPIAFDSFLGESLAKMCQIADEGDFGEAELFLQTVRPRLNNAEWLALQKRTKVPEFWKSVVESGELSSEATEPVELNEDERLWLDMLKDASLEGNPQGWDIPLLLSGLRDEEITNKDSANYISPETRRYMWSQLSVEEQNRLKCTKDN